MCGRRSRTALVDLPAAIVGRATSKGRHRHGQEFTNMPGMTKEMRDGVVAAFDALSKWRDEIETVNERCLKKVLDQTSTVARSMGWPDQAVRMTREQLENASKAQTEMIDQIMEGWKQQMQVASSDGHSA